MKQISPILFFTILVLNLNAQIVFTNLVPDSTINEFTPTSGYAFDFNEDGKIDVHLALLGNIGTWVMRLIPDDSEDANFVINEGEASGGAKIINYGDNISSATNMYKIGSGWGDLLYGHWDSSGNYGHWTGEQTNKYLGFKFDIGGNYHYAWLYLSTKIHADDDMEFTVQSYAYNTVPNEAIFAGDEGAGINVEGVNEDNVLVYPNPANNLLKLSSLEQNTDLIVNILDVAGKCISITKLVNSSIDISNLNSGIYFLSINTGNKIYNRSFVKR